MKFKCHLILIKTVMTDIFDNKNRVHWKKIKNFWNIMKYYLKILCHLKKFMNIR
jgi:hypothetical protein